ncbi:MAG: CBS domain-containing protein [Burkholderiales bacterium]|nr:CBS domain-containing protein [Burkholderiales bacterium]
MSDYMSASVITIAPDTEFHLALDLMRQRNIHHLPVVREGRIEGIVGERDLLVAGAHFGRANVPVSDIMKSPVICISDRASLAGAARMLLEKRIGGLPVVNARKELVGIITETDIFKVMAGMARPRKAAPRAAKPGKKARAATARRKPARRGAAGPTRRRAAKK